jgi:hypothetical protein
MRRPKLEWFLAIVLAIDLLTGALLVAFSPIAVRGSPVLAVLLLAIPLVIGAVSLWLFYRRSRKWLWLCAAFHGLQVVSGHVSGSPFGFTWGVGFKFRVNDNPLEPINLNVTAAALLVCCLIALRSEARERAIVEQM